MADERRAGRTMAGEPPRPAEGEEVLMAVQLPDDLVIAAGRLRYGTSLQNSAGATQPWTGSRCQSIAS
jgi:hypothetical protein